MHRQRISRDDQYWARKRAPRFVAEALECHGGNGFIADLLMERLYREAPLNDTLGGHWQRHLPRCPPLDAA
jgi:alkylation response protein AidB-like acyl-CoA dehydrogenase